MSKIPVTFDPQKHQYFDADGLALPSVTGIIGQFRRVRIGELTWLVDVFNGGVFDPAVFDKAADFGNAIHEGGALLFAGKQLDYEALHPSLVKPLMGLEEIIEEYKMEAEVIEEPMASAKYRFAGTPDFLGRVKLVSNRRSVVDIKTGGWSMAGPQMSGYEMMDRENYGHRGQIDRFALTLDDKEAGKWSLRPLTRKADKDFFMARLATRNFLDRRS